MKSCLKITGICLLILAGILSSCKKEGVPPAIETLPITNITTFSAIGGGNITSEGSGPVIARGVCWGTKLNPTVKDIKTEDGSGTGSFNSNINGLYTSVAYFVRAYATNSAGTSYGETKSFVASGQPPVATISAATDISTSAATLNGFLNANSISTSVAFQYGTTAFYDSTVYADQSPLSDVSNIAVSATIGGLSAGTLYHFRIIAYNPLGTFFSSDNTFRTSSLKTLIRGF